MIRSIVLVGWGAALLALAGCSDDSTPVGKANNAGGSSTTGGSAGTSTGTAGHDPDQGGSTGGSNGGSSAGGNETAGSAGMTSGGGGASGSNSQTDASTTANDGSSGSDADSGDWTVLFNGKDLSNWTSSVGQGQNAASSAIYAVDMLNGEAVIHVYPTQADQSDQPQATLRTKDSYSSYVYHEEYMWGTKRFGGRKQTDRDNGICFHINGDNQDIVWPQGLEFQIGSQAWPGDWVVGNVFTLANSASRAKWTYTMMNGQQVYSPNGTQTTISGTFTRALTDKQRNVNPPQWNVLELTVHGDKDATYVVNGEVANKLTNMEWNDGGTWKPLDHGPIAIQAEFAEMYVRNVKIKVLQ